MQAIPKPSAWIQANRYALNTFAEFAYAMPDPMSLHTGVTIEDCHVTVEPFDRDHHGDIAGLIITDTFVTHVGRTEYRGVDSLVSLMFHSLAGLRAMYANLNHQFWQLVDSDVGDYIKLVQPQIDLVNAHALPKTALLAGRRWVTREMATLPDHLAHLPINKTALVVRVLDHVVFGLELVDITSLGHCYEVTTVAAVTKGSIEDLMQRLMRQIQPMRTTAVTDIETAASAAVSEACLEYSRLEAVRDQPAAHPVQVKLPPAPRPDPTIDVAMLAIVKTIEECLQIDLGRALYTLELNLKAPLKRTMTITTPDTRTLNKAADSVYSTCVKIGKDRKRGCSVTVSCFARSVVVTITPTDRVIHI